MKKLTTIASCGVLLAASGYAGAASNFRGSDTMFKLTTHLLNACAADGGGCGDLTYIGGGSGNGQTDLTTTFVAGTAATTTEAELAPMSRPLNGAACNNAAAFFNSAKGWVVAADALVLLTEYNNFRGTTTTALTPVFNAANTTGEACDTDTLSDNEFVSGTPGTGDCGQNEGACVAGAGEIPNVGGSIAANGASIVQNNGAVYTFGAGTFLTQTVLNGVPSKLDIGTADLLRVLFTGRDHDTNNAAICTTSSTCAATVVTEAQRAAMCGSDLRRTIISRWTSLFSGCTTGQCPTGISHLWRRGDDSGTTDTLLSLVGAPGIVRSATRIQTSPFCNGLDWEDKDPVRVACVTTEQVCTAPNSYLPAGIPAFPAVNGVGGDPTPLTNATRGVLQAVNVPEGVPVDLAYPTSAAGLGVFRLVSAPRNPATGTVFTRCVDGTLVNTNGKCLVPVRVVTGVDHYSVVNSRTNRSVLAGALVPNPDGRVYNHTLRDDVGAVVTLSGSLQQVGAFYHSYTTQTLPACSGVLIPGKECDPDRASVPPQVYLCQEPDSTDQVACLTGMTQCSIGFSGRTGAFFGDPRQARQATGASNEWPKHWVDALEIKDVVAVDSEVLAQNYGFSRKLFFNTLENSAGSGSPAAGIVNSLAGYTTNTSTAPGNANWASFMSYLDGAAGDLGRYEVNAARTDCVFVAVPGGNAVDDRQDRIDCIVKFEGFIPLGTLGRGAFPGENLQCSDACGGPDACL